MEQTGKMEPASLFLSLSIPLSLLPPSLLPVHVLLLSLSLPYSFHFFSTPVSLSLTRSRVVVSSVSPRLESQARVVGGAGQGMAGQGRAGQGIYMV